MTRYSAAIALTLMIAFSFCESSGAATITVYPRLRAMISANPDGGPALTEQVRDAVVRNPAYAQTVIAAMRRINDQRLLGSIAAGLAGAQLELSQHNPAAADRIARWMNAADEKSHTAYGLERGIQSAHGGYSFGYIPAGR